jgi:hypothetical protein
VPGGRPHADQRLDVVVAQAQRVAHVAPARPRVVAEGGGDPFLLALVDADYSQGPAELGEVPGAGGGDEQGAAVGENPADLHRAAGAEDAQQEACRAVCQRQGAPGVRADRRGPGVRARRAAERRNRQVKAGPGPSGQRVQHRGEVVPGSACQVDDDPGVTFRLVRRGGSGPGPGCVRLGCRFREGGGQRSVVPAAQELLARGHHRGAVRGSGAGPARGEVHVALPGDVETVPAPAGDLARLQAGRPGADRAAQRAAHGRQGRAALTGIHPGSLPAVPDRRPVAVDHVIYFRLIYWETR